MPKLKICYAGHRTPVIADLRFCERLLAINQAHRPELIFHAAAHKHEPLMAMEPVEAITNHVLGTQSLLTMATAIRWCVWEICSVAFGSVIHTFEK